MLKRKNATLTRTALILVPEAFKYAVYRCRHCGAVGYMRTDSKISMCRHCMKNNAQYDGKMLVLFKTNDSQKCIGAVQVSKFKRQTFKVKPLYG